MDIVTVMDVLQMYHGCVVDSVVSCLVTTMSWTVFYTKPIVCGHYHWVIPWIIVGMLL